MTRFPFTAPNRAISVCGLEIRVAPDRSSAMVIFEELPENPGMSITNSIEWLADLVYQRREVGGIDPRSVRWFEHWPESPGVGGEEHWDEVVFRGTTWDSGAQVRRFWAPRWIRLEGDPRERRERG